MTWRFTGLALYRLLVAAVIVAFAQWACGHATTCPSDGCRPVPKSAIAPSGQRPTAANIQTRPSTEEPKA